jgi:hypothetical protein
VPLSKVLGQANVIVDKMGHNCGSFPLKVLGYVLQKSLLKIYQDITIEPHEVDRISKAIEKGPVLLLPNHRSYMDFLIISFFLFALKVSVGCCCRRIGPVRMAQSMWHGPKCHASTLPHCCTAVLLLSLILLRCRCTDALPHHC